MKSDQSIETELSCLNSMLTYEQGFMEAAAVNPPEGIFACDENRIIYSEAMIYFNSTGKIPKTEDIYDILIVKQKRPELKKHFIEHLLKADLTHHAGDLIKILTEMKIKREIRAYAAKAPEPGLDYAMNLSDFINKTLQSNIGGCITRVKNQEVAEEGIKKINDTMLGKKTGFIPTLIPELDRITNGIPKKYITIIAARPGAGKTDFMLQLQRNFMKQGLRPGIFSLEMDAGGLFIRHISESARIDSMRIENGKITGDEFKMLIDSSKPYAVDDFIVDDSARQTPELIKTKINYWSIKSGLDVIMIDYLTLLKTNYRQERRDLEIGALVQDLNIFAKETGIPIIILSQLNRDPESRPNHKPQIGDLRDSGSIEQEANLVMLLYRPDDYGIDPFEGGKNRCYDSEGNVVRPDEYTEILVAKARQGHTGMVPVRYIRPIHHIEGVCSGHGGDN